MKKNRKGFTLVELLAMLVVLGILMAVAIPNITGILKNQRVNGLKADAQSMVEAAKSKIAKDTTIDKPGLKECLFFSLDFLDDNDDFEKGPNGGEYLRYDSFVIATRINSSRIGANGSTKFVYYVRLVEQVDGNNLTGISLKESSLIKDMKTKDVEKITFKYDLKKDRAQSVDILKSKFRESGTTPECIGSKIKYYTHKDS